MERRPNTASQQTKQALAAALKELMAQKPIENITIHDLTEHCGIRRQTFYYHFEDIHDLINWMFNEEVKKIIDNFDKSNYENFLNSVLDYIEENKHILNSAYNSFGREQLKKILKIHFYTTFDGIITNHIKSRNLTIDEDFKQFLIDFYSAGIGELIVNYCKEEQCIDRKKLISYLFALTNSIPILN